MSQEYSSSCGAQLASVASVASMASIGSSVVSGDSDQRCWKRARRQEHPAHWPCDDALLPGWTVTYVSLHPDAPEFVPRGLLRSNTHQPLTRMISAARALHL